MDGSKINFPCYKDDSHREGDQRGFHKLDQVDRLNFCVNLLNILAQLESIADVVETACCEIEDEINARNMSLTRLCPRVKTREAHEGFGEGQSLCLFPDSDIENRTRIRKVSARRSYRCHFPNLDI